MLIILSNTGEKHGNNWRHDNYTYKNNFRKLKLTQLYKKFKITEINGYNIFGERTETDCHT